MTAPQVDIERKALQALAEGNEMAFRLVFDLYRNRVLYIGKQMLRDEIRAEDVLQEVFIKVWLHREKLPAIDNFKAWLHTVTRNEIYTAFRKQANEADLLTELTVKTGSSGVVETADPLVYKDLQAALRVAMTHLTPQQKRIFELSRLHGLKHAEIAMELNLTRETVKKHMTDALKAIRAELGTHHPAVQVGILLLVLSV